ncbi:coiled-coil domain-containing protein [Mycoplasmoides alvi]|uniref:hypothetical protein n=1 Tax=Mycoplasmoides alvi TaxID=78580 RepID=UPI00051CA226|nr:hypothetical protein [Mycoplasmoides alvi]
MTPKIEKKLLSLQKKISKKFPDVEVAYAYDEKGKVHALAFDQDTNQLVTLKDFKPVDPNLKLFDTEDNQINGPGSDQATNQDPNTTYFDAYDANGNVVNLAYDIPSQTFYDPSTGDPINGQNYFDGSGQPLTVEMFGGSSQTVAVPTEAVPTQAVPTQAVPTEVVPTEAVLSQTEVVDPAPIDQFAEQVPNDMVMNQEMPADNEYNQNMDYMNSLSSNDFVDNGNYVENNYDENNLPQEDQFSNQNDQQPYYENNSEFNYPVDNLVEYDANNYQQENVAYDNSYNFNDSNNSLSNNPILPDYATSAENNLFTNNENLDNKKDENNLVAEEETIVANRVTENPFSGEIQEQNKRIDEVERNLKDSFETVSETANQVRYQVENATAFAKEVESKVADAVSTTEANANKIIKANEEIEKVKADIVSISKSNIDEINKANEEINKANEEIKKVRNVVASAFTITESNNNEIIRTNQELQKIKEELEKFRNNEEFIAISEELQKVKKELQIVKNNEDLVKTAKEIEKVKEELEKSKNNDELIKTNHAIQLIKDEFDKIKDNNEIQKVKEELVTLNNEIKQVKEETKTALTFSTQMQQRTIPTPAVSSGRIVPNATLEIEEDADFIEPMVPAYRPMEPLGVYQPLRPVAAVAPVPPPSYPMPPFVVSQSPTLPRPRYYRNYPVGIPYASTRRFYAYNHHGAYYPQQRPMMRPIRYGQYNYPNEPTLGYMSPAYMDYYPSSYPYPRHGITRTSYPIGFVDYHSYDNF